MSEIDLIMNSILIRSSNLSLQTYIINFYTIYYGGVIKIKKNRILFFKKCHGEWGP